MNTVFSYVYFGHSGDTVMIPNLQFETNSGRKYWGTIDKGNFIIDSLKVIYRWESLIGCPNSTIYWSTMQEGQVNSFTEMKGVSRGGGGG